MGASSFEDTLPPINMEPTAGSLQTENGLPGSRARFHVTRREGISGAQGNPCSVPSPDAGEISWTIKGVGIPGTQKGN